MVDNKINMYANTVFTCLTVGTIFSPNRLIKTVETICPPSSPGIGSKFVTAKEIFHKAQYATICHQTVWFASNKVAS